MGHAEKLSVAQKTPATSENIDLQREVSILVAATKRLIGKEVAPEEVGAVLVRATQLWLRQCLENDWPVVSIDDHIEDFPPKLLLTLESVIETLETAFDPGPSSDDYDRLLKENKIRVDEWLDEYYVSELG